jgi:hypothetical protein
MGGGNEERGYSKMKSQIKVYGREKRMGCTGLDNQLTYDNCRALLPRNIIFLLLVLISVTG